MGERYLVKLNLARNCLRYIIKAYGIKDIYMPFYLCPALIRAARLEGCGIKFYHIDKNFYPVGNFCDDDFILYPNYFGICSENIFKLSTKYKNLIVDNAHGFYMPDCGLASFCSLRKFFNVKDGAYLFISKKLEIDLVKDDFSYGKLCGALNFEQLVKNEKRLDSEGIKLISDCTEEYFSYINIEDQKALRLKKFHKLHDKFGASNELEIKLVEYDVPFVYPYLIRDEITGKKLEQEGHLILRYWNMLPKDFPEYDFYKYLIPVPLNS